MASASRSGGSHTPQPAATPGAGGGRSRLGRGLSSLIQVSLPEPPSAAADHPAANPPIPSTPPTAVPHTGHDQLVPGRPAPAELHSPTDLSALPDRQRPAGQPLRIPIDHITPNPHQPRRTFDMAQLAELAQSIKANGIIQPLVVKPLADVGGERRYELIAGERRWRAARMAGLSEVPAVLQEVDGWTQAQLALVENIQRSDLPVLERAAAYRTLLKELGLTQAELAGRLGEDRSVIANHLRLLELPEGVQQLLAAGELSFGHAKLIAGVADPAEQLRLARLVVSQGLSVRNLERVIQAASVTPPAPPTPPTPPAGAAADKGRLGREAHYARLEKTISAELGMRVQLRANKGKGKITIHFATLEQFDELMEKLGVDVRDDAD